MWSIKELKQFVLVEYDAGQRIHFVEMAASFHFSRDLKGFTCLHSPKRVPGWFAGLR